jgi:membrane protease YdiL (CAAX protease family)
MLDLFRYLKNPVYREEYKKLTILEFLSYIIFYVLAIIPIGIVLFLISNGIGLENRQSSLTLQEKIFYGIIFAPVVEEILFRLILRFNKKNLVILIVSTFTLLILFIFKKDLIKILVYSFLTIGISFCMIYFKPCKNFLTKYFNICFYVIAGLFGILHIYNYLGINISNLFLSPLFAIPQFILGLILGYIRINNGFFYAVLFHLLMNLSLLIS